jgi:hypothetical protein
MIGQSDNPYTLAQKFCFKYNIDPRIIGELTSNIKNVQNSMFSKDNRKN